MHSLSPSAEQPCPAPDAPARMVHFFKHEGRKYKLVKREPGRDAPWYTEFALRGQRYHRSLETNQAAAAQARAIERVIKPAKAGDQAALQAAKVKRAASSLADVFSLYDARAMVAAETKRNNKSSLLLLLRWATGETHAPARVRLDLINRDLVRRAQAAMVNSYVQTEGAVEREARERALRSSRSIFNQAKSIFSSDLIEQYREAQLVVPKSVEEFCSFEPMGKLHRETYFPPDDKVVRETFSNVEGLRESDPDVYMLFWLCLGTGMRRSEAAEAQGEHFIQREGRLWVAGGTGKDGRTIQIPVIRTLLAGYSSTVPEDVIRAAIQPGHLLPGNKRARYDTLPGKLNFWLHLQGWRDEKKMHALRAFVGSKIFEKDARTAQIYLRHKSLRTTEQFYSHFAALDVAML